MKRIVALLLAGALLAVCLVAVLGACGGSSEPQTPAQASPSVSPSGPVVLTVVGEKGQKQFTLNQLEALPAYTGYAGIKSSTGVITLPSEYTGVPLSALADLVGGISEANGVTLVAKDGYGMTFSYAQIMDHAFTAYDPATGAEQTPSKDLTVIVAYAREGKPLGEDEGPLRLMVATPKPGGQVVDGHWSVKWVDRISVTKASAQWKVQLEGAVPGKLDKPTYVNCASPGCHGSGWVDAAGRRWEGVPLYLVAGMLDDQRKHGPGAYNAALARKGYDIVIETATGKVVTIDSRDIAGKQDIVLAGKVDGGELPDEYFPLRLVGPGLSEAQMPGGIARIVVRVK
ncbi:MAG: molybdopterin-dependent oxidoreductase [Actinobacteria bacterium]|nr:molybdopterin-dependent oxidoreductase [Actinomycetota bacterium]